MGPPQKLSNEQREEIVKRYGLGESGPVLAREFKVALTTIMKHVKRADAKREPKPAAGERCTPALAIKEFAKRARSILWRLDGKDKGTYDRWTQNVEDLKKNSGYSYEQAIIQTSKDFPALKRLFREYDVSSFDPNPESHPSISCFGQLESQGEIECEGNDLSYRENLNWALAAAGEFLRTGARPVTCPNDQAYYLYIQATEQPKDFMQRLGQVESKGDGDLEEQRLAKKSGKRSIQEINEMLETLIEESKHDS